MGVCYLESTSLLDVGGTGSHPSFHTVWDQQAVLVKVGGGGAQYQIRTVA